VLSDSDSEGIVRVTMDLWRKKAVTPEFTAIFRGRERGHRIADYVEEHTVATIEARFRTTYQKSGAKRRARSMGDVWVFSRGFYNPINVKAGVHAVGGQPNMVSLAKLTNALLDRFIDSYYLLLVKFTDTQPPVSDVRLVNILDFLDFLHFDSGPGQIMLQADRFARHIDGGGTGTQLSLSDVVSQLVEMRRAGDQSMIASRNRKRAILEERAARFDPTVPIDQSKLNLA
jgi:hypothetical protein